MAFNDKKLYSCNSNGQLHFNPRYESLRRKYPRALPSSKINFAEGSVYLGWFLILACAVVDAVTFYDLFYGSDHLNDASDIYFVFIITGFLFSFEVAPYFLGRAFARMEQGYKEKPLTLIIGFIAFGIGIILNLLLRASEIEGDNCPIKVSLIFLPVITSFCSFLISKAMTDPLKEEARRLSESAYLLTEGISQCQATIAECDAMPKMVDLIKEDADQYEAMKKRILRTDEYYKEYVREKIREYLLDDVALSVHQTPVAPNQP